MYVPKNDLCFAIFCAGLHPFFPFNIKLPFWGIDGATPTHSPKSGWECHIDGATPSYLPTSINQIYHIDQSYPKTGGSCATYVPRRNSDVFPGGFAFCLGITLIDVAYFG